MSSSRAEPPVLVEVDGIGKRFGSVHANRSISLRIAPGSIHGLVGENGAGKSTLAKILSGYQPADTGTVSIRGRPCTLRSPADALRAGIGLLHQDPLVLGNLTVLDNYQIGSRSPWRLRPRAAAAALAEACERFGFALEPTRLVRTLGVGERQQLELVRLLRLGIRLLILDEPTTSISGTQRDRLFDSLRGLAGDGMSVVYVTHKLEEIDELCDRVTVLRAGAVVDDTPVPVDRTRLVQAMFGEAPVLGKRPAVAPGAPQLRVSGVTVGDGGEPLAPTDFVAGHGEVIGLAGVDGSGQRTLLRVLAGAEAARAGTVEFAGRDITRDSRRRRRRAGIEYLPADRAHDGLVPGFGVDEHFALAGAIRRGPWWRSVLVDRPGARHRAARAIEHYRIAATVDSVPSELSGGNQQRLLLALTPEHVDLLLMEHPTRGLDVASSEWVWGQLSDRRTRGTLVVFSSSDFDELHRWSDRILVFFDGAVVAEVAADELDAHELGSLMAGGVGSR